MVRRSAIQSVKWLRHAVLKAIPIWLSQIIRSILKVANGLTPERFREQIAEIRALNKEYDDIEIFCGTEMDILPDATLDFDDELLS